VTRLLSHGLGTGEKVLIDVTGNTTKLEGTFLEVGNNKRQSATPLAVNRRLRSELDSKAVCVRFVVEKLQLDRFCLRRTFFNGHHIIRYVATTFRRRPAATPYESRYLPVRTVAFIT